MSSKLNTTDIELNEDFLSALDLIENTTDTFFVTGKAGTGKSTLLKYIYEHTKKKCALLAPTGVAAVNVGGSTIHSFFGLPPTLIKQGDIRPYPRKAKLLNSVELLIIDEISMVRADLMDAIDQSLKINRKNFLQPFGGVQMVFFGDMFQLPPVVQRGEVQNYFDERYGGAYFFNADVFKELKLKTIELSKIYRQDDIIFKSLLEDIRHNKLSDKNLDLLNHQVYTGDMDELFNDGEPIILLTTNNYKAGYINSQKLELLPKKPLKYSAGVIDNFEESAFPTDKDLKLKVGAQIMMLNNDVKKRWQNGTLGTITKLSPVMIEVEIDGIHYEVEKYCWNKVEYRFNKEKGDIEEHIRGSFIQFPIKLAWAITIHKSQGKTFDRVIIDLDRGAFAHGQVYVAFSRCRSLNGIYMTVPLRQKDIIVDEKIKDYL